MQKYVSIQGKHTQTPCTHGLTQWPSRLVFEPAPLVGILHGREQPRHLLSEATQSVGAAALHGAQAPQVGLQRHIQRVLLSPEHGQGEGEVGLMFSIHYPHLFPDSFRS